MWYLHGGTPNGGRYIGNDQTRWCMVHVMDRCITWQWPVKLKTTFGGQSQETIHQTWLPCDQWRPSHTVPQSSISSFPLVSLQCHVFVILVQSISLPPVAIPFQNMQANLLFIFPFSLINYQFWSHVPFAITLWMEYFRLHFEMAVTVIVCHVSHTSLKISLYSMYM